MVNSNLSILVTKQVRNGQYQQQDSKTVSCNVFVFCTVKIVSFMVIQAFFFLLRKPVRDLISAKCGAVFLMHWFFFSTDNWNETKLISPRSPNTHEIIIFRHCDMVKLLTGSTFHPSVKSSPNKSVLPYIPPSQLLAGQN